MLNALALNQLLKEYDAYTDEENRLHLSCRCDGTVAFMAEMLKVLDALKCSDVKHEESSDDGIDGKPWMKTIFRASGVLPEGVRLVRVENEQPNG